MRIFAYHKNFVARNGREENAERTTQAFRQPPDEVPKSLEIPYSCNFEGKWYREGQQFRMGLDDCSICLCVDTEVKCSDDDCVPPTTTSTTTTTTSTTTAPPFVAVNGDRGERGQPVC